MPPPPRKRLLPSRRAHNAWPRPSERDRARPSETESEEHDRTTYDSSRLFVGLPSSVRPLGLARRASCRKRGRDGTKYSRLHPTNYLSHHLAGIVTAAVFADAAHIVEEIVLLKTRVTAAAAADSTQ